MQLFALSAVGLSQPLHGHWSLSLSSRGWDSGSHMEQGMVTYTLEGPVTALFRRGRHNTQAS